MGSYAHPEEVLSGRYVLVREVGRGATGVVFCASDLRHGRDVAIKLLPPDTADLVGADRFLREIRIAARLNHPHIVAVHDSGEDRGRLYYVMPLVDGESLRQRLDRQRWLPMGDAVRFARQIADALHYAHARGVIHRDVKPENILLDHAGHASLADFGVARALSGATLVRHTAAGVVVGSAPYMSPEQAGGESDSLDGRTDIYSLGCVVFEMVTGQPPFEAATIQALLLRHLTERAPTLRSRRTDVPRAFDSAVRKALEKSPDDRYPTPDAFAHALELAVRVRSPFRLASWGNVGASRTWVAGLGAVVAFGAVYARLGPTLPIPFGERQLEPTRIAVLPFEAPPAVAAATARIESVVRSSLGRWRGLEIAPPQTVADALGSIQLSEVSSIDALDVSRRIQVGRYIHGSGAISGDSIAIEIALHDANASGRALSRATFRVASGTDPPESMLSLVVDSLLFGRVTWDDGPQVDIGTWSYPARRDYGAAHQALRAWDLTAAESLFIASARNDADFARAQLWLAQARNWAGAEPEGWIHPAERAVNGRTLLTTREQELATALVALARSDFSVACTAYRVLRERDPRDFAAWYGLGECQSRDPNVIVDAATPSGWAFRSSYHDAVAAYRRAFEILPSSHRGFSAGAYARIRTILFTRDNRIRWGVAEHDRDTRFIGWPVWQADTLALLPYPWAPGSASTRPPREPHEQAIVEHRRVFHELARGWTRSLPTDPEAIHALALSLEMLGDVTALDTLARARALASDRSLRLRLAASEVWMRTRFSLPDDPTGLSMAAALADSLVDSAAANDPEGSLLVAQLASLIGRPAEAARLARRGAREETGAIVIPAPVIGVTSALLAFAAAGAPRDSIAYLERQAEEMIRRAVPAADLAAVRALHLERAAILAFPTHRFAVLDDLATLQSPVAQAQRALKNGDTVAAHAAVSELRSIARPADLTIDMLAALADLLMRLDYDHVAADWLTQGLEALRWTDPGVLEDVARAGVLGRALVLSARLAAEAHDTAGLKRWQAAAASLSAHAEPWPDLPLYLRALAAR